MQQRPVKTIEYTPRPRTAALARHDGKARMVVAVPKANPLRSESYRRLVAALPCAHCGRPGPSQCAHTDLNKGLAIKACDLQTFPACADRPGEVGCHTLLGATGTYTRDERRALEKTYAERTRTALADRFPTETLA